MKLSADLTKAEAKRHSSCTKMVFQRRFHHAGLCPTAAKKGATARSEGRNLVGNGETRLRLEETQVNTSGGKLEIIVDAKNSEKF